MRLRLINGNGVSQGCTYDDGAAVISYTYSVVFIQ